MMSYKEPMILSSSIDQNLYLIGSLKEFLEATEESSI